MKNMPVIVQVSIIFCLLATAIGIMTGYLVVPKDAETRTALYALAAALFAILDVKSLRRSDEKDNSGNSDSDSSV